MAYLITALIGMAIAGMAGLYYAQRQKSTQVSGLTAFLIVGGMVALIVVLCFTARG
jgi:hypothetical protein